MNSSPFPKRLIEIDLPIRDISTHALREKSIRKGHISTLHIWWARRPLAACRAVLCAALWPDPVDPRCPQSFRDTALRVLTNFASKVQTNRTLAELSSSHWNRWKSFGDRVLSESASSPHEEVRGALLDFISDFANWDAAGNPDFLAAARELTKSSHSSLNGAASSAPVILDPFAGGGAFPLEALRLGGEAIASDLNPIPVLLNKVIIEYLPRYGSELVDGYRRWADDIGAKAKQELAQAYPPGRDETPIAYLWSRAIRCEGPACGAEIPLLTSTWLAQKGKRRVSFRLVPRKSSKSIAVEIVEGQEARNTPTVKLGSAVCPLCGHTTKKDRVRAQLVTQRGGATSARLMAVVTTKPGEQGRHYRLPTKRDLSGLEWATAAFENIQKIGSAKGLSAIPDEPFPNERVWRNNPIRVHLFGIKTWGDLHTPRQAVSLATYSRLVQEANLPDNGLGKAIRTCLALTVTRLANALTAFSRWHNSGEKLEGLYSRQAISMIWDFAEGAPFSGSTGDWSGATEWVASALETNTAALAAGQTDPGIVSLASATEIVLPDDSVHCVATDPPYYDAVPYATLADFFYVWQRRILSKDYPELFANTVVSKDLECVVDEAKNKDHHFFQVTMSAAMRECRRVLSPGGIGVVVFAHKSTAGWEAQLQAMLDAGWVITGSWPIDTEMGARLRAKNSAALASSVHLVCRPRETPDGALIDTAVGSWREVLAELPVRMHNWIPRLAEEGVVGADAIFACLGPALEVFSQFSRVEKASGEVVTLREYLEQVWAAVSHEALSMMFDGVDASGLEEDARLTAMWLWTLQAQRVDTDDDSESGVASDEDDGGGSKRPTGAGYLLEFDAARKIAQGLGAHLERLPEVVEIAGENARLLSVAERASHLFKRDESSEEVQQKRASKASRKQLGLFAEAEAAERTGLLGGTSPPAVGATTLDRLHQAMVLFGAGRSDAVKRFIVEEGVGNDSRFWRLAQSLSALYPASSDEKRWVDGVLARKKSLGF